MNALEELLFKMAEHSFQVASLILHNFKTIYALAQIFCKSQG